MLVSAYHHNKTHEAFKKSDNRRNVQFGSFLKTANLLILNDFIPNREF